jgi:ribosomal-protein-serine acetyltransferase
MDKDLKTQFELGTGLVMRAWREDDTQIALDIVLANREHLQTFMRWMTPDYSIESARQFIAEAIVSRLRKKNLGLAIFREGVLIGSVGLNTFNLPARTTEIGYWVAKDAQGDGVVTKACRTLIQYVFDDLGLNRIELRCSTVNTRSAAVAERLGFTREGTLRQAEFINEKPHDFYIYGLLAEDPRVW